MHTNDRRLAEAVAVETRLEYLFRLGLRNTSTIEYPAGITVSDVPVPPTAPVEATVSKLSRSVIQLVQIPNEWEMGRMERRDLFHSAYREKKKVLMPSYEMEVLAPAYLVQGQNATLKVSIKALNHDSKL